MTAVPGAPPSVVLQCPTCGEVLADGICPRGFREWDLSEAMLDPPRGLEWDDDEDTLRVAVSYRDNPRTPPAPAMSHGAAWWSAALAFVARLIS